MEIKARWGSSPETRSPFSDLPDSQLPTNQLGGLCHVAGVSGAMCSSRR